MALVLLKTSELILILLGYGSKSFGLQGPLLLCRGFPGGASGKKNPPTNAGDIRDVGLIPGSRRSPGGRNGNPLQYSCLGNLMDRGAWWATVHMVA